MRRAIAALMASLGMGAIHSSPAASQAIPTGNEFRRRQPTPKHGNSGKPPISVAQSKRDSAKYQRRKKLKVARKRRRARKAA